ncbi:MAG TPA: hypothetical protein EYQ86_06795 [Bacteroidetes bacterium]|jgi:hypothetical protein|nr:hypothetical protein [Bacteroidota bacterium]
MEKIISGSVPVDISGDEEIEESLEILMKDEQFEQDLINSFNDQMYIIKETAPNPIWTLCSITMRMIRILPRTEVIPIDEWSFTYQKDDNLIECLVGTNLVKVPKKYVQQGEWH